MKRQILISSLILLFAAALAIADDLPYKPGEMLVRFANPDASTQEKSDILDSIFGCSCTSTLKEYSIVPGLALVELPSGTTVEEARVLFAQSAGILYSGPNYKVEATVVPNDSMFSALWGLDNTGQAGGTIGADIDAPEAWDLHTGSSNIVVAVTDTGVDYTHPDLVANRWVNTGEIPGNLLDDDGNGYVDDVYGYDFFNEDADPMDDNGHGTHVSGTIGAVGNNNMGVTGVCWTVKIMALKMLNAGGGGYLDDSISAVQYAVNKGAKVINASWGGYISQGDSQGLYDAIAAARDAGVLFVAGAGNDNVNNDTAVPPFNPASYDLANVISVMASTNTDAKAYYSNYGLTSVDIGAPGGDGYPYGPEDILSTVPDSGYDFMSGTSMASPHVAGACALLLSADPCMVYTEVKQFLLDYSDPLPSMTGRCVSGGRLNLFNAVSEVLYDSTPPSPDPAEWEVGLEPNATGLHTIAMEAKEATDRSGVEYFFECVTDANKNSGWQDSRLYVRGDFDANTIYTFRVKYSDKSDSHNEGGWSVEKSTTTAYGSDNLPPFPNPSLWKTKPKLQSMRPTPRIGMQARDSFDETGPVSYYFTCIDVNGAGADPSFDSGWITSNVYTISSGLTVGKSYTFTVKARDALLNVDANSDPATVTITSQGGNLLTVPVPYHTIQDAIDHANNGDIVEVRPGTYTGLGNRGLDFSNLINPATRAIIVRSMDPDDPNTVAATVINCQNMDRAFYFHGGEDHNSVVCGFTIINATAVPSSATPPSSPSTAGTSAYGGAIACFQGGLPLKPSEPNISKCVFRDCAAAGQYGSDGVDGGDGMNGDDGDSGTNPGDPGHNGEDGDDGGLGGAGGNGGGAFGGAMYFDSGTPQIIQCQIIDCRAIGGNGGSGGNGGNGGSGGNGGDGAGGDPLTNPNGGRGGDGGDGKNGRNGGDGGNGGDAYGGAIYFGASCQPLIVDCEIINCNTINGTGATGGNGGNGGNGGGGGGGGAAGPPPGTPGDGGNGGYAGDGGNGGHAGYDGSQSFAGAIYYEYQCNVTMVDTIITGSELFINDGGFYQGGNGGNGGDGGDGGDSDGNPGNCRNGGDGGYGNEGGDGGEGGVGGNGGAPCADGADRPDDPDGFGAVNQTVLCGGGNYYEHNCIVNLTACTISDNNAVGQNYYGPVGLGGGEYYEGNCNSVFNSCRVEDNNAGIDGGGIYFNSGGTAAFNFCDVNGNVAESELGVGGGICGGYVGGASLGFTVDVHDTNFSNNDAEFGGGIYLEETLLTVEDSNFSGNTAFEGAGVWDYNCTATVKNCMVKDNLASFGGGFSFINGLLTISSSCLTGNNAAASVYGTGGAIFFEGWSDYPHQVTNCLITDNTAYAYGGGLSNNRGSWVQITNCTFAGNQVIGPVSVGGGVSSAEYWAWVDVDNSILWGNGAVAGGSQIAVGNPYGSYPYGDGPYADVNVAYSDVQGGEDGVWLEDETQTYTAFWWLAGNIDEDPLFAGTKPTEQTYFLSQIAAGQLEDSNCVDAGYGDACDLELIIGMPLTTRTDLVADSCAVDMGYHYQAGLVVPQYQLTIEVVDQGYGAFGTVLPPWEPGTYDVNQGRVIELYADPDPNWEVYKWTGSDYIPVYPPDPNYNKVTMNSDKTVTVEFQPSSGYKKLVTHVIGDGTIDPPGLTIWPPGTVVPLTATPANPSEVVIWTGTDDDLLDSHNNTVTMDAHKEVFAQFYSPRTLYVPADYPSIQLAIDEADDRDIIEISAAPEPYYTQLGFEITGKAITITSTNPDDPCCVANTIIERRIEEPALPRPTGIFRFNEVGHNTILNGLTIRGYVDFGGTGTNGQLCAEPGSGGGWLSGGGISCGDVQGDYFGHASPTIKNCVISDCSITGGNGGNGFNGCAEFPDGGAGGWPGRAYGAALACFDDSSPIVINCTFQNNIAVGGNGGDGGDGNPFPPGPWGWGGPGGGWYYGEGNRWYYYGLMFDLYTEYTGRGGAVYVGSGCSPEFIDCTFTNNSSFGGTNGICGLDGSPVDARYEPSIRYKIDNFGGAVYVAGNSTAQFIGCVFSDNLSDTNNLPASSDLFVSYGGAIAFEDESDLAFEECTFSDNVATIGGAIYSSHSDPVIGDCNFTNNSALHGGGALFVGGAVNITGSDFSENEATVTAGEGGGISCLGVNAGIVDCNITNNDARGSGGGIYISNKDVDGEDMPGENAVLIKNCLIAGNFASRDGGGISANWYSEPNIINCTIADNRVTGIGFEGGFGGGLYCSYNSYAHIINSIIWGNSGNIGIQGSQLAVATGIPYDPRPSTVNVTYSDVQDATDPNVFGARIEALDLVFCIDSTGSMEDDIDAVKEAATEITSAIKTNIPGPNSRMAVVDYKDFNQPNLDPDIDIPYGGVTDYPYRTVLGFTTDANLVVAAIDSLTASGGGDGPESVYTALMHCIDHNSLGVTLDGQLYGASPASSGPGAWRHGNVMRVVILMGDAPPHDPEPFTNYVLEDIVTAAGGVEPKRIVSLLVGGDAEAAGYFASLASETGGTVLQAAGAEQVVDALMDAIDLISVIPDPIFVDVNCVLNWDPCSHSWDPNSYNIDEDPCFVAGYFLSQIAAGQDINSPCVDSGSADANDPDIGLDSYTTRTDSFPDTYDPNHPNPNSVIVDMGYHYKLFIAPQYQLTSTAIAVPDLGSADQPVVDPNGSNYYYQYMTVHLTVSPSPPPVNYQVLWTGTDNDALIGTENTVLMDENREVTVTFVKNTCELTTGVIGSGGTIAPAGGTYSRGEVVDLTAFPSEGYRVKRWIGTDNDASNATTNTVTMSGDKTVYVEFELPVTITVPGDYSSIQQALDAAEDGDMVLIAPGTYTTSSGYYIHDANITISGIAPEDPCVVAATAIEMAIGEEGYINTSAFIIYNVGPETVLNGITIRGFVHQAYNGLDADELGEDGYNGEHAFGGGIVCYMASPTIKNCIIADCSVIGGSGGNGFDGSGSDPEDPNIRGTDGGWPGRAYGGGLACLINSNPAVINCTFENCSAIGGNGGNGGNGGTTEDAYGQGGRGGGWYYGEDSRWYNVPWVNSSQGYERTGPAQNSFYDFYNEYTGRGGAVFVGEQCYPTFTHCTFINNRTEGGTCGITGLDGWPPEDRVEPSIPWEIENFGGAVFCEANSSLVFTDCNFVGNTADINYPVNNDDPYVSYGGALAWETGADVILENCIFSDNLAAIGGAMYWSKASAQIVDCNVSGNLAYQGGGLFGASSLVVIEHSIIQSNFAGTAPEEVNDIGGQGGGIYGASMDVEIFDSNISDNEADTSGGGLFFTGVAGLPLVTNCLITGNFAGRDGGGISANWHSEPNIVNCTIADNVVTGLGFEAAYGGGLCCSYGNHTNIINSIIWNNYGQNGPQLAIGSGFEYDPRPSTANVSYSDVMGGIPYISIDPGCALNWGVGNIQADPCFVTGPLGSYYLSQTDTGDPNQTTDSLCVDAGNDLASNVGLSNPYTTRTDEVFDTNVVDMGYHYLLAHPIELCSFCDLSHDGLVDLIDYAIFSLHWLEDNCSDDNDWCGGADLTFDTHVDFKDQAILDGCWLAEDTDAPLPNPSKWEIKPYSTTTTPPYTISMTAETAFDSWGGVVEYYFECVTHDNNSGWNPNTTYVHTNLDQNTVYGYRVKARDERDHETLWSIIAYAVAGQLPPQPVDNDPPQPDPMTWALVPTATGSSTIMMTATTADDGPTGTPPVEYYFECTTDGDANSNWQASPTYVASGLTPTTEYTFMVKARDGAIPHNETGWSDPASATTTAEEPLPDTNPPINVVWEVAPYETGGGLYAYANMTAAEAIDLEGSDPVEYYFECVKPNSINSGWTTEREWNNVSIGREHQYLYFHFRTRDSLGNTSGWSVSLPCY